MSDTQTAQADALHDRYRRGFVGRSRASRDLAALDSLIADTEAFLPSISGSESLRSVVSERLAHYRTERAAIGQIHAGGADAIRAWRFVEWSEVNNLRYRRSYGGQPRVTRDAGLLAEFVRDQGRWVEAVRPLAAKVNDDGLNQQVTAMHDHLKLYTAELDEVQRALKAQAPIDRATTLAELANRQFALWRLHFQGKPRSSRRAGLLQRMIGNLEMIQNEMIACRAAGVTVKANADNITKVGERVKHHKEELVKILEARTNTPSTALVGQFGDDANAWIARYRDGYAGKSRNDRDLAGLDDICEGLHEIARVMDETATERGGDAVSAKNLTVVLDHVKMCEREWGVIRDVQRPQRPAN